MRRVIFVWTAFEEPQWPELSGCVLDSYKTIQAGVADCKSVADAQMAIASLGKIKKVKACFDEAVYATSLGGAVRTNGGAMERDHDVEEEVVSSSQSARLVGEIDISEVGLLQHRAGPAARPVDSRMGMLLSRTGGSFDTDFFDVDAEMEVRGSSFQREFSQQKLFSSSLDVDPDEEDAAEDEERGPFPKSLLHSGRFSAKNDQSGGGSAVGEAGEHQNSPDENTKTPRSLQGVTTGTNTVNAGAPNAASNNTATEDTTTTSTTTSTITSLTPLIPDLGMNAYEALKIYFNDSGSAGMGPDQVVVALLDTGVDLDHPEIAPMLYLNVAEVVVSGREG